MNRTMKNRFGVAAFWMIVGVLVINALRLTISPTKGTSVEWVVIPYTVVLAETVTDASGAQHRGSLFTQAVRSDGSSVQQLGTAETGGRIISLVDGRQIMTTPREKTKTTWLKSGQAVRWGLDPKSLCTKDLAGEPWALSIKVLGEEPVSGYRAVKLEVNQVIRWFALDYGCAPIQTRMEFGSKGSSEMRLVSLSRGEPNPALFAVPSDYQETGPR